LTSQIIMYMCKINKTSKLTLIDRHLHILFISKHFPLVTVNIDIKFSN